MSKSFFILGLALFMGWGARSGWAQTPPGETVLLIYYSDLCQYCGGASSATTCETSPSYPQNIETTFYNAISAIPGTTVNTLTITHTDSGIYTELNTQYPTVVAADPTNPLTHWCQVYDLRFQEQCNNNYVPPETQPDMLTSMGANNDFTLFQNYLANGGNLFLIAEHHDFYIRNTSVIGFINTVAASPVVANYNCNSYEYCPDVVGETPVTFTAFTNYMNFSTDYNNLTGGYLVGGWVGGIDPGKYGSGHALTTLSAATTSPSLAPSGAATEAMALYWGTGDFATGYNSGTIIAAFETNAFAAPAGVASEWVQNAYDLLSNCQRLAVTKTFATSPICVGTQSTFTICYQNNGSSTATNVAVSDTIPAFLTYNGSNPSPSGNNGTNYWWTIPSVAAGGSGCVAVTFTANSLP